MKKTLGYIVYVFPIGRHTDYCAACYKAHKKDLRVMGKYYEFGNGPHPNANHTIKCNACGTGIIMTARKTPGFRHGDTRAFLVGRDGMGDA